MLRGKFSTHFPLAIQSFFPPGGNNSFCARKARVRRTWPHWTKFVFSFCEVLSYVSVCRQRSYRVRRSPSFPQSQSLEMVPYGRPMDCRRPVSAGNHRRTGPVRGLVEGAGTEYGRIPPGPSMQNGGNAWMPDPAQFCVYGRRSSGPLGDKSARGPLQADSGPTHGSVLDFNVLCSATTRPCWSSTMRSAICAISGSWVTIKIV